MTKDKPFFNEVDLKANFPAMENQLLKDWYKKGIVKKYLQKNKNSKKYFSFLDGPITANNPMGVHHAWGRTYKDIWHPGDVKKSIAKFVDLCKKRVYKYADIQTEQSKRLGYFMDWDNSYYTLSDENNYMIWHFLKKCHEKGLIYKGRDSVPWCPRCGTAISQHEMLTEDYKEVTHDSVYVEYPIKGRKNEFLLVWTTTPWTLPGNVAVAVDSKKEYAAAQGSVKEKTYYLLKDAAKRLGLKVIRTVKGKELIGLNYESPFDNLPRVKKALGNYVHEVIPADERILEVSEKEGTGLVHVAPGAGSEDFQMGKKLKLPVIELIDEEANYLGGMGDFSNKNAKKHPEIILSYLKEVEDGEFFFDIVSYTHRYPACWRCKTELVWRVVDEWYIAIDPVREDMKKVAKKIHWIPEFGLKRELDWLNNMHDWLISKKRYWGVALPIWECKKCNNFEVIGSKEELKKKAIGGWDKFEGESPHRPWVDEVEIKCSKCGELAKRIPDVGNPWLDAGIVSFSTITKDNKSIPLYLEDRKEWEKWFPADFITESFPGQFKNWFYSLIAMSTVLEDKEPFKTVLGFATLFAEDGRAMHKSLGNMIEFNEGADKIGVDVMRWMYAIQDPKDNLPFGYKVADEVRRKFHLKLWNIYNFFIIYANLDKWRPSKANQEPTVDNQSVLDQWIIARLNQTIRSATEYLEKYDAYNASVLIEKFVDDLSNWYIRRSRERVGPAAEDDKDKNSFYQTLYFVLVSLTELLAPFTPYLADFIYMNLTKKESVHFVDWPKTGKVNINLVTQMAELRDIVERVHAKRKEASIPVRQPLQSIKVVSPGQKPNKELLVLIKDELNIKEIDWTKGEEVSVKLDTRITSGLKEEAKTRELIRRIQQERKKLGINLTQKVNVKSPWLPVSKELIQRVHKRTLSDKLEKGKFKVTGTS
jgi:isoleucyl-tRNA synthetase